MQGCTGSVMSMGTFGIRVAGMAVKGHLEDCYLRGCLPRVAEDSYLGPAAGGITCVHTLSPYLCAGPSFPLNPTHRFTTKT